MLTHFASLILGLVEGFTEFLPISSTAHLILASRLLGLDQSAVVKSFEISIQSGAMLAVIVFYWRKFLDIEMLKRIVAAFIPTAIIGLLLYKVVKSYFLGNMTVVLLALGIGGIILILFERFIKKKEAFGDMRSMSYKDAMLIGVAQAVAVIPGVSRSAATIVGGMLLGMSREAIVEFSFLLAVPTILAATGLDFIKNIHEFGAGQMGNLAIGFVVSFVAALVSIQFLLSFIRKHSFERFGIYRIAIVVLFAIFLL